jgi:hypothetical protein
MVPQLVLLDSSTQALVLRLPTMIVDEKTVRGTVPASALTVQRQYYVALWLVPHPAATYPEHCAAGMILPVTVPVPFTVAPAAEPFTITSLDPVQRAAGSPSFSMRVNGTGFRQGAFVRWTSATGVIRDIAATFLTTASLDSTVPADLVARAGDFTVSVVNPDGRISNTLPFRVFAALALTSLEPAAVDAGSAEFTLGLNGAAFARTAQVRWNGAPLETTWVSDTRLTARVTAALLERPGTATVSVTNPDNTSAQANFTVRPVQALVTSLSPGSTPVNSNGFTLTVSGRGFLRDAVVVWDGSNLPSTWRSSTQLEAQVSASLLTSARSVPVQVANPQSPVSDAVIFAVSAPLVPSLASLEPGSREAGSGDFTLLVSGRGFLSGATVRWNGENLPTTFRSDTRVEAAVAGSRLAAVATAQVTAVNPGSAVSGALTFSVTAPVVSPGLAGLGGTVSAATQGNVTINLTPAPALAVQGTLTATFQANAANLGGGCQPESGLGFVEGQNRVRTRTFSMSAGQQSMSIPFEVGSVAGTITIQLTSLTSAGANVLAGRTITSSITVERSGPAITASSVRIENATGSSFDVTLTGTMPGRELTDADFTFTGAAAARLDTTMVTIDLRQAAPAWFQSANGCTAGGRFLLRVPFSTANGDNSSIASVSVVLKNGSQVSGAVSGGR